MFIQLESDDRQSLFFLSKSFVFSLLSLVFLFCGCASLGTYNPATGRNELIFISTPEEISLGEEVQQKLNQEYTFSRNSAETERVRRIGQRVAQVSDRQDYQYHFYLIEKDEMNAFTTPGGNIYLFSGLVDELTTEDQIASVIAHEVGHCAARHTVKKYQAALGYNLIGNIVLGQVGGEGARQIASMSSNVVMSLVSSAYSRRDEYEADRLGVKYLRLAGYDPEAMIQTLELLEKESKGINAPIILRSHPYIPDRITAVKKEISLTDHQPDS
ncbi:MAG: M48 family metalloprotease [Candidatus Omnitrophica bacterium]|nr:M48 family metalloprotease [Candidatus Omnitrophota bacterium]